MTPQEIREKYSPFVTWALGGLSSVLLAVCAFFLMNLYGEFKELNANVVIFQVNQQVLIRRVDIHDNRLDKLEDQQKQRDKDIRIFFEEYGHVLKTK